MDWTALGLTLKLATITTLLLMIVAIFIALWLSSAKTWYKTLIESIVTLPLILPPTVLGFYLLLCFNPNSGLGLLWFKLTNTQLAFSFSGLVIASIIYSLPFAVRPIQMAFESVQKEALQHARLLGAGFWDAFFTVCLPLSKQGIFTAMLLVFAHTIGEFGVVLMVGGSIAGKTKVISVSLYEQVEQMHYGQANQMALMLVLFSLLSILLIQWVNRRRQHVVF